MLTDGLISSDGGLVLLRPGKTLSGVEVRTLLKHLRATDLAPAGLSDLLVSGLLPKQR